MQRLKVISGHLCPPGAREPCRGLWRAQCSSAVSNSPEDVVVVHGRRTAIGRAKRGGFKVEAAGTGTGHRFGPERPATPADTSCVCPSIVQLLFPFALQNFISRLDVVCTVYVSPSIKFKCINQSTSGASKRHNGAQIASRRNTGAKNNIRLRNMIEITVFPAPYLFLNQSFHPSTLTIKHIDMK